MVGPDVLEHEAALEISNLSDCLGLRIDALIRSTSNLGATGSCPTDSSTSPMCPATAFCWYNRSELDGKTRLKLSFILRIPDFSNRPDRLVTLTAHHLMTNPILAN